MNFRKTILYVVLLVLCVLSLWACRKKSGSQTGYKIRVRANDEKSAPIWKDTIGMTENGGWKIWNLTAFEYDNSTNTVKFGDITTDAYTKSSLYLGGEEFKNNVFKPSTMSVSFARNLLSTGGWVDGIVNTNGISEKIPTNLGANVNDAVITSLELRYKNGVGKEKIINIATAKGKSQFEGELQIARGVFTINAKAEQTGEIIPMPRLTWWSNKTGGLEEARRTAKTFRDEGTGKKLTDAMVTLTVELIKDGVVVDTRQITTKKSAEIGLQSVAE